MGSFVSREKNYKELIKRVGEEKFEERLKELIASANNFICEAGYENNVECNERIMLCALLDYYADIFRLKDFHNIENVRTEKIIAYTVAWVVRRKPLQYIRNTDEEKDVFVNERFAAYLLLNECLLAGEKKFISQKNRDKFDEYLELLLYYFKYRECNPQVFELAIESFKMGMLVEK